MLFALAALVFAALAIHSYHSQGKNDAAGPGNSDQIKPGLLERSAQLENKIMALTTELGSAQELLAILYLQAGDYRKSLSHYAKALRNSPPNPELCGAVADFIRGMTFLQVQSQPAKFESDISAFEFWSNGEHITHIAVSTRDGAVFHLGANNTRRTLDKLKFPVRAFAFSPDGLFLAAVTTGKEFLLWRADGEIGDFQIARRFVLGVELTDVIFDHAGRRALLSTSDSILLVETGTTNPPEVIPLESFTSSLALHPTKNILAVSTWENYIKLINLDLPDSSINLPHLKPIKSMLFTRKGDHLVSASTNAHAEVWRVSDGKLTAELKGHHQSVAGIFLSPEGDMLVSCDESGLVSVWETSTWKVFRPPQSLLPSPLATALFLAHDSMLLFTISGHSYHWDIASNRLTPCPLPADDPVFLAEISVAGNAFFYASKTNLHSRKASPLPLSKTPVSSGHTPLPNEKLADFIESQLLP